METIAAVALAIAGLWLLISKIGSFFSNASFTAKSKELKSAERKANESTAKATASRESFLEQYRKYKSRK